LLGFAAGRPSAVAGFAAGFAGAGRLLGFAAGGASAARAEAPASTKASRV
jgi:hypothetical protein